VDQVSVAVALADKIDTLVGFWTIDEKPTGSKDPFALRRAALGVIRLILECRLRLSLIKILSQHGKIVEGDTFATVQDDNKIVATCKKKDIGPWRAEMVQLAKDGIDRTIHSWVFGEEEIRSVITFFADRLK